MMHENVFATFYMLAVTCGVARSNYLIVSYFNVY